MTKVFCKFAVDKTGTNLMVLRYRVSLPGLKGFARVYELDSTMTLYEFNNQLRSDLEFPQDQLIQFKAFDAGNAVVARYAMFDLGYGTVDNVSLADTVGKGIVSFNYFYDVTNKKYVIITFEGEVEPRPGTKYPVIVESKGPNPIEFENGYVAYEDLPEDLKHPLHHDMDSKDWGDDDVLGDDDDDSDADNDDEDDDEDGKQIFDGNEDSFF